MKKGLLINDKDNVAVVLEPVEKDDFIVVQKNKDIQNLTALEDIPIYHKIAVADIKQNDYVFKYGEIIGTASKNIKKGEYVHTHNIESTKKNEGE